MYIVVNKVPQSQMYVRLNQLIALSVLSPKDRNPNHSQSFVRKIIRFIAKVYCLIRLIAFNGVLFNQANYTTNFSDRERLSEQKQTVSILK